jgi:nucleotide-binding universal stress UspA family protein
LNVSVRRAVDGIRRKDGNFRRWSSAASFDLIVIGHSDHSELWRRLLGDTADRIADHASCSVLIVKQ